MTSGKEVFCWVRQAIIFNPKPQLYLEFFEGGVAGN